MIFLFFKIFMFWFIFFLKNRRPKTQKLLSKIYIFPNLW
nr:utative site-specific DNA endonuclease [Scenedesmaceae sp. YH-2023b]